MLKEVVRGIESGVLGTIGLVAFVLAFVLVLVYVARMRKSDRTSAKQLPLEDDAYSDQVLHENGS